MDTLTIRICADRKALFKRLCSMRNSTMTAELNRLIQNELLYLPSHATSRRTPSNRSWASTYASRDYSEWECNR